MWKVKLTVVSVVIRAFWTVTLKTEQVTPADPETTSEISVKPLKKKKRTPGTDWLDVTLIKIVANFIASALCHDLNQSFTQSTCPQSWKNS